MLSVEINISKGLEKMLDSSNYSKVTQDTLLRTAVKAEEITRREAPIDTGNLRRTINHFAKPKESGVYTKAKYWVMVEYGTKPHNITPKNPKGFLAWKTKGGKGEWVRAKQVRHPGNEPNPFVKRSLNKVRSQRIPAQSLKQALDTYVR